jgi:arginine-tRNA-protein transferase
MFPPTRDQFRSFLLSPWSETRFVSLYLEGDLVCVAVTDQQPGGLSAIYTFFEPTLEHRSLGVVAILQQIALARDLGLDFLYLGYWIRDCEKMRYKTDYRPLQVFVNGSWLTLT